MTQRMAIVLLSVACLGMGGYLLLTSLLLGREDALNWETATRMYVEEYQRWLSESPNSGWARVETLARGSELGRIEKLRSGLQDRSGWRYAGGEYRLLLQAGGKALVDANYRFEDGGRGKEVHEAYVLEKTLEGPKVIAVLGGSLQ
ncbi:MAG: hypothetical protein EPO21_03860 [Chloroflexota bacterium]|nr:MAG: hypothetical protein EPO21_03860 [Chloroflexota bacterium]